MGKKIAFVALASVLAVLVASCSKGDSFPTGGTYRSTADVAGAGPVTVTFNEDGTLLIEQGGVSNTGTYTVDGDQITISDPYCKDLGFETATYTWKLDGSTLRMTTENDGCTDRKTANAEMTAVE